MSRGWDGGKATPGRIFYPRQDSGEDEIAIEAYGDSSKGGIITKANPQSKTTILKKGKPYIIPGNPPPSLLADKQPDDMTFLIDGMQIPMISARIVRTMDTGCDGWTARFPWTPGENADLDRATRPYGYPRAAAYIGNELLIGGCLYIVAPEMTDQGLTKGLHGFSFTADAIDSHVQPPYEFNNVTMKQLAEHFLPPLGIKAVFETDTGGAFARVTSGEQDSIFGFLSKLAAQRGVLVSSTPQGDLLFLRANASSKPVGTLTEDQPMVMGWKAVYDGRKRYNAYKCITKGAKQGAIPGGIITAGSAPAKQGPSTIISIDDSIPRSRWMTFHADDTVPGNIHNAARWKKNRQFVDALTHSFPVSGWYAPDGSLWRVNTTVTVISPTLGVPDGYTFLIRAVEYNLENNKRTAVLSLVPPQAYTDKDIGVVWK